MSEAELEFDEQLHLYSIAGVLIPSVTQILDAMGLTCKMYYNLESAILGKYVHLAIALDEDGELDESTLSDPLRVRLAAWRAFRKATQLSVIRVERPVHCGTLYAGTADIVCVMGGKRTVLDIKTGAIEASHQLQTAAYAALLDCPWRACVYLHDDGTFRFIEHKDQTDIARFREAANLFHWKRNHGLLKWPEGETTNGD